MGVQLGLQRIELRLAQCRLAAFVVQPLQPGDAGGLIQPTVLAHRLGVDEQRIRHPLHRPAVVQQQQRVHPPMHRARRVTAHHPKQVRPVRRGENRSAHGRIESEPIRAVKGGERIFSDSGYIVLGMLLYESHGHDH